MVRLVVVENDIVDGFGVADLLDIRQVLLKKAPVANIDEGGFLLPLYQIGVVGSAVFGLHHNVKHPHSGVQRPYLIDPFCNLLHWNRLRFKPCCYSCSN